MEKKVLSFVDGRLKPAEHREVEAHLAVCPACRMRAAEFRAVSGLLDELPMIEPSSAFDLRVHARVGAEPARRSWWAWITLPPRVAVAASALLVVTIWLGSRPPAIDNYPGHEHPTAVATAQADEDFRMIKDLPVLEDYDVLSNFEPLADLPPSQTSATAQPANTNN
jgi:hypothetical protein